MASSVLYVAYSKTTCCGLEWLTQFTVRAYTDHSANVHLQDKLKGISSARLATWHTILSAHNIVLEHRKGDDPLLSVPDALSRLIRMKKLQEGYAADRPSAQNPSPVEDDLEAWSYSQDLTAHYEMLFGRLDDDDPSVYAMGDFDESNEPEQESVHSSDAV
jgi:hypothetical protein